VYKQKVKHLLYEHQNVVTKLKADGEMALKLQQDEFRRREGEMGGEKRGVKTTMKEAVGGCLVGRVAGCLVAGCHVGGWVMHPSRRRGECAAAC
jgi:hypothetical protein